MLEPKGIEMKTSEMVDKIVELVSEMDSDDLMDLYNYLFPKDQLTIGEIEIDE